MADGTRWTEGGWRSPAGVSSIAAAAGVLVTVVALLLGMRADPQAAPGPTTQPTPPSTPTAAAGPYVFVYGTAMPGHSRYEHIATFVAEATPDSVSGRIFDTGAKYPAAKFGAGLGTIQGYVLRLRPDRAYEAMSKLTEIEGGLFHPTTVTTAGGVEATAYEYLGSTEGMAPVAGMWAGPEQ